MLYGLQTHVQEIINIGIATNGKFIMSASKDTQIKIWDLKGKIIFYLQYI